MAGNHEWGIENFSCWDREIHTPYFCNFGIVNRYGWQVFPRDCRGDGEDLVVNIPKAFVDDDAELVFIGSDGAVICTQRSEADCECRVFTGPKFEDVVAQIRRNEPLHKDRLILRWKTPRQGRHVISKRFCTVIPTFCAVFQIKYDMLDSKEWSKISDISFLSKEGNERSIQVWAGKTESSMDGMVRFKFEAFERNELITQSDIWLLNSDDIMNIPENNYRVPKWKHQIIFFIEVPSRELQGLQMVMRCKIITGKESIKEFCYQTDFPLPPEVIVKSPPKFCKQKSQPENAVTVLSKDLMRLYQDNELTDLELRCGTVTFPTHRAILSARSPVFKDMLSGDMRGGHVDIPDLDPQTLGRFLTFLYSGTTGEDALQRAEASSLYYAADRYQVPSLKEECLSVLLDLTNS